MKKDTEISIFSLVWDFSTYTFTFSASGLVIAFIVLLFLGLVAWRLWHSGFYSQEFEIDQAEIGVGTSKFRFKPNVTDRQVAYAIWVELSTRKIGLPIDTDHDVISEIYDSWYNFFSVTRDLIKSIPATQIKRKSTSAIINLSIEVLNEGLRPHLTRWQARFRSWYNREVARYEKKSGKGVLDPQQIQAEFPDYKELKEDLERVNNSLIRYRKKMRELIMKD